MLRQGFPRRSIVMSTLTSRFAVIACCLVMASCSSLPGLYKIGGKGEVRYQKMSWCVPGRLKRVLRRTAHRFGDVTVFSTWRSPWHNRRVGGAAKSLHKRCKAVDFRVDGDMDAAYAYVKSQRQVGGHKRYRSGHIHIDTGPRRSW